MTYERFVRPVEGEEIPSEYDLQSWVINEPQWRNIAPIDVRTIDLSVAGSLEISSPGYGFVMYGYNPASPSTIIADAYIAVRINYDREEVEFPCKTNRGYVGAFTKLFLSWPAQPLIGNPTAEFRIFKSQRTPWQGG